jgi:general stress protein 26
MAKDKVRNDDGDGAAVCKPKDPARKLRKLIKNARVAMLTTVAADGTLRSRPMAAQGAGTDGELWFFTRYHSPKSEEIQQNQRVNVSYASRKNERYVSISGTATLVQDPARVKEMWRGEYKAWFPEGKNDPELALLKVRVDKAEYWDADENKMVDLNPPAAPAADAGRTRPSSVPNTAPGGAQG